MIRGLPLEPLTKRLSLPRKFIQVIFGSCQMGKPSTILQVSAQGEGLTRFAAADGEAAATHWLKTQWEAVCAQGDFVIEKRQKLGNIEVKSTADRNQKGGELFAKKFKPRRQWLLGDGGMCWEYFLKMDVRKSFV